MQDADERFWSLAVALQLIEEHLADLHCPDRSDRPRWREAACRAWGRRHAALRADLQAALDR